MKLSKEELTELLEVKKKVENELKGDKYYLKLGKREDEIIENLGDNKKLTECKKLLEEYKNVGEKINEIEINTAYKITIEEKERKEPKGFFAKLLKKEKEVVKYQSEFDKISEDVNYKKIVKRHNEIFKELIKMLRQKEELLYELESIETEMATIKTDKIREYLINNE